jgi:hypothetical protein
MELQQLVPDHRGQEQHAFLGRKQADARKRDHNGPPLRSESIDDPDQGIRLNGAIVVIDREAEMRLAKGLEEARGDPETDHASPQLEHALAQRPIEAELDRVGHRLIPTPQTHARSYIARTATASGGICLIATAAIRARFAR